MPILPAKEYEISLKPFKIAEPVNTNCPFVLSLSTNSFIARSNIGTLCISSITIGLLQCSIKPFGSFLADSYMFMSSSVM